MQFAGFVKNSFVDYPGLIATVVFTPGCNMDCWYCHNRHLWKSENIVDPKELDAFLKSHLEFIDGVVISGGEPTLQSGLEDFIKSAAGLGYKVKLDTNGTKPEIVKKLLPLLDYIAMDLKAPPGEMRRVVSYDMDETPLWETADMLMDSMVDYEFRTTFMPLLETHDIESIAKRIQGAKKYALQQYRKTENVGIEPEPHKKETLIKAAQMAEKYVEEVVTRGI